jgi:tetratricopeptide (TPR) repeat protein
LEFPQRRAGDTVHIIVKKEGYVVVNDVQLQIAIPADADNAPLMIILAKEQDREEMARRFYRLKSFDAIEETYSKRLKELEDTQQATALALAGLQQERDQAKAAAEKASEELAKSQSGQTSELYQEAKRLFVNGKIDEAIKLLDDEKLRSAVAEAQQRREEAEKAIEIAVQAWLLKAQLLIVQFRFDEAEAAYLAAIDSAPDSFEANFPYALFNGTLLRFQKAVAACNRCLELARKSGKKADLALALNEMGLLNIAENRMEDARHAFAEALVIGRELAKKNPESYQPFVALTLNALGVLDMRQNRIEEARQAYSEALTIGRELAKKSPEYQLFVVVTLTAVAGLDSAQHRVADAQRSYEEALETERKLVEKNSEYLFRPSVSAFPPGNNTSNSPWTIWNVMTIVGLCRAFTKIRGGKARFGIVASTAPRKGSGAWSRPRRLTRRRPRLSAPSGRKLRT